MLHFILILLFLFCSLSLEWLPFVSSLTVICWFCGASDCYFVGIKFEVCLFIRVFYIGKLLFSCEKIFFWISWRVICLKICFCFRTDIIQFIFQSNFYYSLVVVRFRCFFKSNSIFSYSIDVIEAEHIRKNFI